MRTSDDRRTRILDAAEELFARHGFDATATARIAEEAAVPKGLVFYYFPRKLDLLLALLDERLPAPPSADVTGLVVAGDPTTSLLRLQRRLGLDQHESLVMRSIIFRESATHTEVRRHLRRLRDGMIDLTGAVLEAAVGRRIEPTLLAQAAQTFVAVMLDHANARRAGATLPDLEGAARIVALAVQPV